MRLSKWWLVFVVYGLFIFWGGQVLRGGVFGITYAIGYYALPVLISVGLVAGSKSRTRSLVAVGVLVLFGGYLALRDYQSVLTDTEESFVQSCQETVASSAVADSYESVLATQVCNCAAERLGPTVLHRVMISQLQFKQPLSIGRDAELQNIVMNEMGSCVLQVAGN